MAREMNLELKIGKTFRVVQKSKVGGRKIGCNGQSDSKQLSERDNGAKRSSNVRSNGRKISGAGVENVPNETRKLGSTTRMRKRVYAEENLDHESYGDSAVLNSKASRGQNLIKSNLNAEKGNNKLARTIWGSHKISRATNGKKPSPQHAAEVDERDVAGTDSLKKNVKRKPTLNKPMERNQEPSRLHPSKKTVLDNKKMDGDSGVLDEQPKKKKRVIKIDPFDFSNKRLDDGDVGTDGSEEKKKESMKSNELSMNAQFRAIQPSSSILSFVEENYLGRRRMIELRRAGYNIELSAPLDNVPFSTGSERERIEENLFRNKLEFFAAAKVSSSFPPPEGPEIAFAGRSNVGKSSLLNALTRQWGVVRISDKPGQTQTINFFELGPKLRLVDLPGYGFAYAKDEVKEAWEELVKEYVSTRVGLKRVCLLVDTKWGLKPRDRELIDLMERSQTKYQVVLTKTDIVFPIDVARRAMQIEESLKRNTSVVQPVLMVSSKSGAGIRSLRTVLAKIARFSKL